MLITYQLPITSVWREVVWTRHGKMKISDRGKKIELNLGPRLEQQK